MKKMFFMAAIAALALSSCSSDEIVASQTVEDGAVSFSAYAGRANRAGTPASTNPIVEAAGLANAGGFGVFAYEHGKTAWNVYRANNTYPNFFYNQQVWGSSYPDAPHTGTTYEKNGDVTWAYAPIKYYSNNEGAQHSFFAYAPYDKSVKAVFTNEGPAIRYVAGDNYDLLWAQPTTDMTKADIHETINFDFKHALSKVSFGATTFVNDVHEGSHTASSVLDAKTEVHLRSIKFVGNVPSKGLLSLTDGSWTVEASEESAYEFCPPEGKTFTSTNNTFSDVSTNNLVIPTDAHTKVKVQVIYDVVTTDEDNPKNSSSITNTVVSKEEFELVNGTAYKFCLDLGLTSVKFTADVADWGAVTNKEVDLPNNHKAEKLALTDGLQGEAVPTQITMGDSNSEGNHRMDGNVLKKYASSIWGNATEGVYSDNITKTIYVVSGSVGSETTTVYKNVEAYTASTANHYVVWTGSAYVDKEVQAVDSIIPDSEGKLYHGGTPVTPSTNDVLSCGGQLYIWK